MKTAYRILMMHENKPRVIATFRLYMDVQFYMGANWNVPLQAQNSNGKKIMQTHCWSKPAKKQQSKPYGVQS